MRRDFENKIKHLETKSEKHGALSHLMPLSFPYREFSVYYTSALNTLLELRLQKIEVPQKNAHRVPAIYFDEQWDTLYQLVESITQNTSSVFLVPMNLYDRHWADLVVEKEKDDHYLLTYIDPENQPIPTVLEFKLRQHFAELAPEQKVIIRQRKVETQKYGNCGPEVVENFIEYLTGQRVFQEAAVLLHSRLTEDHLLNRKTPASVLAAEFPPKPSHEEEFVVLTPDGQVFNPQNEAEIKLRDQLVYAHNGGMVFDSAKVGLAQGYKVQRLTGRNDNSHDTLMASPHRLRAPSFDILDEKLQNQACHYVRTGVAFDTLRRAANIQPAENNNRKRALSLPTLGKSLKTSI